MFVTCVICAGADDISPPGQIMHVQFTMIKLYTVSPTWDSSGTHN